MESIVEGRDTSLHRKLADVPLEKHLQSPLARPSSRSHALLLSPQASHQISHLYRSHGRVESFVPALGARAIDGLLERVRGQNAEGDRHSRLRCDTSQT